MYTGQPLDQLVTSDVMVQAFMRAHEDYWPMEREMLALMVEHLSALLVAFLKFAGVSNVGSPISIPRPSGSTRQVPVPEPDFDQERVTPFGGDLPPNVVSFSQFASMLPKQEPTDD